MILYRSKPLTVEAMQWDGTGDHATEIVDWVNRNGGTARHGSGAITIDAHEGTLTVHPLDYIVRGAAGEFSPRTLAVFAGMYEPLVGM